MPRASRTSVAQTPATAPGAVATGGTSASPWWAALALLAAVLVTYSNSWHGAFLFDDWPTVLMNDAMHEVWPPHWAHVSENGGLTTDGRPLAALTLALNWAVGGKSLGGYHAVNIAIHAAAVLTLFGVLRRALRLPSLAPCFGHAATSLAFCTALLWAVHPLTTNAVTYIVQRVEAMAACFTLLALYCFVRGVTAPNPRRWFGATLLVCLLGVATKETFATVPVLLLLVDRTFVSGTFREAWKARGRWHLVFAATWLPLAALMLSTGGRGASVGAKNAAASWDYLVTQTGALTGYLQRTFWPANLIFDYGMETTPLSQVLPQAILIVALLAVVGFVSWRWPRAGFLPAVWFLLLAPTSSVVPVITQTIAEHRVYLPTAAILTGVVLMLFLLLRQRVGLLAVVTLALAAPLAVTTIRRNEVFRDPIALWRDTLAKRPQNWRVYFSLAVELHRAARPQEAIEYYNRAVAMKPDAYEVHYAHAMLLVELGDRAAAVTEFERALAVEPRHLLSIVNLGQSLLALQRAEAALPWLEKAVEMDAKSPEPKLNLASALVQVGQAPHALEVLERVVREHPAHVAGHYNLGIHYARLRRVADAEREYRAALALAPGFADAHQNLGNLLMREGRTADAAAAFAAAVQAAPDEPVLHYSLALSLAEAGRPAEGLAAIERFLATHPNDAKAAQIRANLRGQR